MNVLVIDNYDSFTYNLVQYLMDLGAAVTVRRNDRFEMSEVEPFGKILLSPGPGIPSEAGLMPSLVKEFAPRKSILGVCLGHQCIGEVFGGTLRNVGEPLHGKQTPIDVDHSHRIFHGVPAELQVGRYHSWVVNEEGLPGCLRVTARDKHGIVMALRHTEYDVHGVQFHPESILTDHGHTMLENWLKGEA